MTRARKTDSMDTAAEVAPLPSSCVGTTDNIRVVNTRCTTKPAPCHAAGALTIRRDRETVCLWQVSARARGHETSVAVGAAHGAARALQRAIRLALGEVDGTRVSSVRTTRGEDQDNHA